MKASELNGAQLGRTPAPTVAAKICGYARTQLVTSGYKKILIKS